MHVRYKNRYGRERSYYTSFEGAIPYIERRHSEAESDSSRERFAGFMREVPCPTCHGSRLKPIALAVTVDGRSIAEICAQPIGELAKLLRSLELSDRDMQIAGRILKEVNARLGFLLDVGLDYLSPGPGVGHAGGRGGAADPAGDPDRVGAGGGAVCAG